MKTNKISLLTTTTNRISLFSFAKEALLSHVALKWLFKFKLIKIKQKQKVGFPIALVLPRHACTASGCVMG